MQALTEVLYIFDQSVQCQASTEVGIEVGVSVRNVGTQVAPKIIEKGIVCISFCNIYVTARFATADRLRSRRPALKPARAFSASFD